MSVLDHRDGSVGDASLELRKEVREAIDSIQSKGSFATFGHIPNFVDPQLSVDPCGPIRIPLMDVDASRIIAASHQAPFGKASDTILDPEVRRTWELNSDQITITDAEFQRTLDEAVSFATAQLGVTNGAERDVEAQLYKLLLYEKGALFKPHTE